MRSVPFDTELESWEEMEAAGRYNRGPVVLFRDRTGKHRVYLGCGDCDDVEAFREHGLTFLVSRNYFLGYVGLGVFEGSESVGETFLQADHEIAEILGKDGLEKSGWWIAKVLAEYATQD